jgi:hypothetical protein
MTFLTPLFLFGALAIAAPLIYHLIKRTTRERTIFSSLMFLLPSPPRLSRKNKLEDLLLLLLRCLAIGLLAFGFGRPFFRNTAAVEPAAGQTKRVVVLVDRSASMRRAGIWTEATNRVLAQVRSASPADQFAVYGFSNQAGALVSFEEWRNTPASGRADKVAAALGGTGPDWGNTRLGTALITAAEALADATKDEPVAAIRQIVLISDLQSGADIAALQSFDWPKGVQLKIESIKARNATNAGLQLLVEAPDAAAAAATAAVRVRITNAADSSKDNFQVGWTRPGSEAFVGQPVDQYVPAGQARVVTVPVPTGQADLRQITLKGDDEPFDNVVYAVPPEKQRVPLAYLGRELPTAATEPLFYLQSALKGNESPRLAFDLVTRSPDTVSAADLQTAKVIFATELPAGAVATELRSQMQAGKTVVFAPKSAAAAGGLAAALGLPSVPLADANPGAANGNRATAGSGYAMFGEIDFRHPLFAEFADPLFSDFTKINIWKYRRLGADAIPGARILARFDQGDPAVVEVPLGAGRMVLLLTTWSRDDSTLAVIRSKFIPLVYNLLDLGGAIPAQLVQYTVGDPIPVALVSTGTDAVTVTPPDGPAETLATGTTSFTRTRQPGIYQLAAGARSARVSVNLDVAESRTAPMPMDLLERYGAPGEAKTVDATREARREALLQSNEAEGRQKLWRWFIGATLVVLLIETAIAGWTARRNTATVATGGNTP